MWKLKPSPRTIKATEKYIASLGRKREELTEEQWNLMVTYVQNRRVAIPSLIIAGLFCTFFTFLYYLLGQGFINKTISSSEEIQWYLSHAKDCFMNFGMAFMVTFYLLFSVVLSLTLVRVQNRKMHRILLSRPATTVVEK